MCAVDDPSAAGIDVEQHSIARSIVLHLLPGLLTLIFFCLAAPLARQARAPSTLAFLLAVAFVHIPFQLGYLLYQGKKSKGRLSLQGILLYREHIPLWQYVVLGLPCLIWLVAVSFVVFAPISNALLDTVFGWLPDWFHWDPASLAENANQYSTASVWLTVILMLVVGAIPGPLVEELYYRGYLLPRISRLGKWAPLVNAALFALDHMYEPWLIPAAFVGFLPMVYAVWWKKNIYLGVVVHCGLMILSALGVLAAVLRPV
jgi:heme/copper-type cytochrome/quinol oxidase subunit 4